MAKKREEIDITGLAEVSSIAEEVRRTREPKSLRRQGEEIALIVPTTASRPRASRRLTESDPLFELIGIGRSGIPAGMSGRKREALLAAHRQRTSPRSSRVQSVNDGFSSIRRRTLPCLTRVMLITTQPQ